MKRNMLDISTRLYIHFEFSPNYGWEKELVVVLERRQDGLPEEEVGEDAAGEDDEHGGDPEGEGVLPGEGERACGDISQYRWKVFEIVSMSKLSTATHHWPDRPWQRGSRGRRAPGRSRGTSLTWSPGWPGPGMLPGPSWCGLFYSTTLKFLFFLFLQQLTEYV